MHTARCPVRVPGTVLCLGPPGATLPCCLRAVLPPWGREAWAFVLTAVSWALGHPHQGGCLLSGWRHPDPLTLARDEVSWAARDFSELCSFWRCRATALSRSSPQVSLMLSVCSQTPTCPRLHILHLCPGGRHLQCGCLIHWPSQPLRPPDCFQAVRTVSRAVMNIHTQVSLHTGFPLIRMMDVCVLNFCKRRPRCLPGRLRWCVPTTGTEL